MVYPANVSAWVSADVGIWWTAMPVRLCKNGGMVGRECEVGVRMRRRRGLGMGLGFDCWVDGLVDGGGEESIAEYICCWIWYGEK